MWISGHNGNGMVARTTCETPPEGGQGSGGRGTPDGARQAGTRVQDLLPGDAFDGHALACLCVDGLWEERQEVTDRSYQYR